MVSGVKTGARGGARGLRSGENQGPRARTSPEAPRTRCLPPPLPRGGPHSPPQAQGEHSPEWSDDPLCLCRPWPGASARGWGGGGARPGAPVRGTPPAAPRHPSLPVVAPSSTPPAGGRSERGLGGKALPLRGGATGLERGAPHVLPPARPLNLAAILCPSAPAGEAKRLSRLRGGRLWVWHHGVEELPGALRRDGRPAGPGAAGVGGRGAVPARGEPEPAGAGAPPGPGGPALAAAPPQGASGNGRGSALGFRGIH